MSKIINVVIADDHFLVREGVKKIVAEESIDIKVVQEATNAAELLKILSENLPDIVILDITMPGRSGLNVLKDIKGLYPKLPVLILSMHPVDRYAVRVIKAGAAGYLTKSGVSDELIKAIRVIVNQKKQYISQNVAEQLAQQLNVKGDLPLHESLSDREFEVLCMIANGKRISTIAEELSLSVPTVHTYRARVKEKMNMKSNVEIARYAIKNSLID
ncbi:MAG: response regulator transcription factor [Balneolaceae bacterium]